MPTAKVPVGGHEDDRIRERGEFWVRNTVLVALDVIDADDQEERGEGDPHRTGIAVGVLVALQWNSADPEAGRRRWLLRQDESRWRFIGDPGTGGLRPGRAEGACWMALSEINSEQRQQRKRSGPVELDSSRLRPIKWRCGSGQRLSEKNQYAAARCAYRGRGAALIRVFGVPRACQSVCNK